MIILSLLSSLPVPVQSQFLSAYAFINKMQVISLCQLLKIKRMPCLLQVRVLNYPTAILSVTLFDKMLCISVVLHLKASGS